MAAQDLHTGTKTANAAFVRCRIYEGIMGTPEIDRIDSL
jgi:hypothetical protein